MRRAANKGLAVAAAAPMRPEKPSRAVINASTRQITDKATIEPSLLFVLNPGFCSAL
jgi:hypothetical protein